MAEFRKKRKKICHMCAGKTVDYKDVNIISKYVNDNGKFYQEDLLVLVLSIKDMLLNKLKEQDSWDLFHFANKSIA